MWYWLAPLLVLGLALIVWGLWRFVESAQDKLMQSHAAIEHELALISTNLIALGGKVDRLKRLKVSNKISKRQWERLAKAK